VGQLGRRAFLGTAGAVGIGTMLGTGVARAAAQRGGRQVVYVGSYTSTPPAGRGLDVARDAGSALTLERTVPGVPDASWFAVSGHVVYSTIEQDPSGSVAALDIRDPANPRPLGTQPTNGSLPTHLSVHPSGRYLLTANYGSGSVVVHPILRDGSLGEPTDLASHVGPERDPHAHQVIIDPSGRWVLAVDLGADSVYVYKLDLGTGKLVQHHQVLLPSGAGPRHLAFHPNGRVAYIVQELRSEITMAAWQPRRGVLTLGEVVPTVGPDAPNPNYPGEIAVSRDAQFVYASNRGENSVATFAVLEGGWRLRRLGENVPTGGDWPRHLALDAGGRRVFVSNQRSGTVTCLPRDPGTGALGQATPAFSVPSVAVVHFG
jgi:6-phosphogluconolactonase